MRTLLLASALTIGGLPVLAQSASQPAQPGFNLFSVSQDIEIGRQSAIEAEKQLRLLNDSRIDSYLTRIVQRLAAQAPGARYPYSIKTVNAMEINAFALPGGPMYINRGTLQAARSEAELAGVLAHEMSHVALRHGTHQASKAYLSQAGLGILGGLLGRQSGATRVVNAIGGVGLNVVFLKFSRDDEYQADRTGAQIMARAGYNPLAMAAFFDVLRAEQGRDPGKVEQFLSDHPGPSDRAARIRQVSAGLTTASVQPVGGFDAARTRLQRYPAPSGQQVVSQSNVPSTVDSSFIQRAVVQVEPPSSRFLRFAQSDGFFTIDYPENWKAYQAGFAVSMAPDGGVVTAADGKQVMLYGVIVNHYAPFEGDSARWLGSLRHSYAPFEDRTRPRGTLEDGTDDLVRQIMSSNSYLSTQDASAQPEVIDGAQGFSVLLSGRSPVTGTDERVTVYTRALPDGHVIYAIFVVPETDYATVSRTFGRMLRTLSVNDEAAHRSTRVSRNPQSQERR